MKFLIFAITIALIMPIGILAEDISVNAETRDEIVHYVLAEDFTASWCSHCPSVAQALHNIYNSGDYPFFFVSMICDKVEKADKRKNDYNIPGYPTVIFDGGYEDRVGSSDDAEEDEREMRPKIQDSAERTDYVPLTIEVSFFSIGEGVLEIYVNMKNEDSNDYTGHLRAHITEIVSRYIDKQGKPYPFGFLDFAFDEDVSIRSNSWLNKSVIWNGSEVQDKEGNNFGDIIPENIMIISALFNSEPHLTAYDPPYSAYTYIAYYVDQVASATVSQSSYDVELNSSQPNKNVNPGESVYYEINVKNKGKRDDNISITTTNISNWDIKINNQTIPYSLELNAGQTKTVYARITAPSDALANTIKNIEVIGTSQGDNTRSSKITLFVTVNAIYNVELTCNITEKNGNPSDTIIYEINVKNKGNADDTILLELSPGSWEATLSKISIKLNATQQETALLSIKIPSNAPPNAYEERNITATSCSDNTKRYSITIKTTANALKKVEITAKSYEKYILNGSDTKFTLYVKNTGNINDSYTLSYELPNGWNYDAIKSLSLDAYETKELKLTIKSPSSAIDNEVANIKVNIVSDSDNNIKTTISLLARVKTSPNYDMSLQCPQTEKTGNPGDKITYWISITNNGNVDDTFNLSLSGENSDWGSLSSNSISLEQGEDIQFTLIIIIPMSANYGDKAEITITVLSEGGGNSKNLLIRTIATRQTDLFVKDINVFGILVEDNNLTIEAMIENTGEKADNVKIAFYVDNYLKNINTINIDANSKINTEFIWLAIPGEHTLKIIANYDNSIIELNNTNNELKKTIIVKSLEELKKTPPTILSVGYSPLNPKANEEIIFYAEIIDEDIDVVKLSFCSPSGVCSFPINMTLINGNYTTKVKISEVGITKFTIIARDTNGNMATKEIKIDILPSNLSKELRWSPNSPKVNQEISIYVYIQRTDISKVYLRYSYDGENWDEVNMNLKNGNYTAKITPNKEGKLFIKIIIRDKQGKETVYIENSINIGKQETIKGFIPSIELFIILIGIVGAALIFRRRK